MNKVNEYIEAYKKEDELWGDIDIAVKERARERANLGGTLMLGSWEMVEGDEFRIEIRWRDDNTFCEYLFIPKNEIEKKIKELEEN